MKNIPQLFTTIFLILWSIFLMPAAISAQKMNNNKMQKIFETQVDSLGGTYGAWHFQFKEREMYCFTDENNNRMRIISPIALANKLDEEFLKDALVANFHTALDVKYAISEDIMWSVFIHPLKELSQRQLEDALTQVFWAAETFGTTFTSTDLVFPGSSDDESEEKQKPTPTKKM